jgi:hypothetical protein
MRFFDYIKTIQYRLSTYWKKKLSQQYADSFKILKKIENLAYRLKFSDNWRIHLIIFVIQLESMSNLVSDFYKRYRSKKSKSIYMKKDNDNVKSFVVERLINKRIISKKIEYLCWFISTMMIRFKSVYCMSVVYWLNCDTRFWLLPSRLSISKKCESRDSHYF